MPLKTPPSIKTTKSVPEELPRQSIESRRQQAIQLTSRACNRWFDSQGNWIHPTGVRADGKWIDPPQPIPKTFNRLVFWLCMGLFGGSEKDVDLGNAILRQTPLYLKPQGAETTTLAFDIFVTNHSMQMLALHGEKLDGEVRSKIEDWARVGFTSRFDNRNVDLQFHGFNDNMPAKATLGLILGGEYFENKAALEHGLWNLHQLADLLTRRGLISEYNSPTYTPFTLVNLTVVSQYAQSEEARDIAAKCCERIWGDIFAHFHRPTAMMGGPYSRAYHFDSTGHLSTQSFLLWLVLDHLTLPHPIKELEKEPIELLHAHGFAPEALSRFSWVSSCKLTPPPHLLQWAQSRQYPFEFRATAERGGGDEKYCSEVRITQYQEEDFSLGTSEGECWSLHQSEPFYFTYRRQPRVQQRKDIGVAYTRFLINDEQPNDPNQSLDTHGSVHTLQEKREALILARPSVNLADKPIRSLRFCLIIPEHFGSVANVYQSGRYVFIEDGEVRYAIRALNPSNWGGATEIKFDRIDNYLVISLENYSGEARHFSSQELQRTLNGFVFSIARTDEETKEKFQKRISGARYLDYFHFGFRTIRYQSDQTKLEFCYAPGTDHVRYAAINGKICPNPIWQADGLPPQDLPFLGKNPIQRPLHFPYNSLEVSFDKDTPWCISDHPEFSIRVQSGEGWRT